MPPSFEFCAFRFWNQWHDEEAPLYKAISGTPTDQDVRVALNYFKVARTFKGIGKDANLAAYIRGCLIKVRGDATLSTPAEKVEKLTDELQKKIDRVNVSAASKLLWLSFRNPFVIYDSRADYALRRQFNARFVGYREYAVAWRNAYAVHEAEIAKAVGELPKARVFMRTDPPPDHVILRIARGPWFKERVFDTFLWEIGA
jgi:hypothetical protein